jgi:hypothetical protein
MYINIEKLLKKDGTLKNEYKVKTLLRKEITNPEYGDMDFIQLFHRLATENHWTWQGNKITEEDVIDHLLNDSYRIIKAEVEFKNDHGNWKADGWVLPSINSGRLLTRPVEFDTKRTQAWIEIDFHTSL